MAVAGIEGDIDLGAGVNVGVIIAEDIGGAGGIKIDIEPGGDVADGIDADKFAEDIHASGRHIGQGIVFGFGEGFERLAGGVADFGGEGDVFAGEIGVGIGVPVGEVDLVAEVGVYHREGIGIGVGVIDDDSDLVGSGDIGRVVRGGAGLAIDATGEGLDVAGGCDDGK